MLLSLSITDFVIVDTLHLEFGPGFTVLTGETGAGKSIILDALALLLGDRADGSQVREDSQRAELSALFDIAALPAVRQWLADNALNGDEDGELLLRRVIDSGGRSRNFINGQPATLAQLKTLGEQLVDIHGQHAHQSLTRPDMQRRLLDAYAGALPLAAQVRDAWQQWRLACDARQQAEQQAADTQTERERLSWQINELSELDLQSGEWAELNQQHDRLANAVALRQGAQLALDLLSDEDNNCLSILAQAQNLLGKAAALDSRLSNSATLLDSVEAELREATHELRSYADDLDEDPQSLAAAEARLAAVVGLARKYRVLPEDLPEKLADWQQQLTRLDAASDLEALAAAEQAALQQYRQLAAALSETRAKAARELSQRIGKQMQSLAMNGARFEVALLAQDEPAAYGQENIEYQVAANAGTSLRPLAKVASGGELSRISLAMQVVISQVAAVPTLIFDEVDSGIGGGVAETVGKLLKKLGSRYQVLAITHLPQVATCGDAHWLVSKLTKQNRTRSDIKPLDDRQRIQEVARMLGGKQITDATLQHAQEMLAVNAASN